MLEEDNHGTDEGWTRLNETSLGGCRVDTLVTGAWPF